MLEGKKIRHSIYHSDAYVIFKDGGFKFCNYRGEYEPVNNALLYEKGYKLAEPIKTKSSKKYIYETTEIILDGEPLYKRRKV